MARMLVSPEFLAECLFGAAAGDIRITWATWVPCGSGHLLGLDIRGSKVPPVPEVSPQFTVTAPQVEFVPVEREYPTYRTFTEAFNDADDKGQFQALIDGKLYDVFPGNHARLVEV